MSTKTTYKRIALVAVAALGFGTLSVVAPTAANAALTGTENTPFVVRVADTVSNGASFSTATGQWDSATAAATVAVSQIAGPGNFIELFAANNDTQTASGTIANQVTVTGTTLVVAAQPTSGADTYTVNSAATIATSRVRDSSTAVAISGAAIRILIPAVGTYTATVSRIVTVGGIATVTELQVFTITGTLTATRGVTVLANSTSLITDSETARASLSALKAATTLVADATVRTNRTTARVAAIRVNLNDGQATPVGVPDRALVAVVSGAGLVGEIGGTVGARVATATTDSTGAAGFAIYGDGTAGTGTITITQGTTVVGVETFTFTGPVTTTAATALRTVISTVNGADLASAIEIRATDAAGNLVTGLTTSAFTATTSNAAVLQSAITVAEGTAAQLTAGTNKGPGHYYVSIKSAAAGTIASGSAATLTVAYRIDATTTVSTAAVPFTTGGATIAAVTLTADNSGSALAGDRVTLTLSARDAAGNPVADGTYVVLDTTTAVTNAGALTSSQNLTNTLFGTGAIAFVNGVRTATFFAPVNKVVLTGLLANAAPVAAAIRGTTITTTVDVSNAAADAAIDAANEAASAAQDATDAAIQAADAADEATAAVAALTLEVNTLIAGLKKQLTTLTNLVIRIQKKVRA